MHTAQCFAEHLRPAWDQHKVISHEHVSNGCASALRRAYDRQDTKVIEDLWRRWSLVHSHDLLSYGQLIEAVTTTVLLAGRYVTSKVSLF
jgi:hypothetical protein